jgi:hypothetical protein
LGQNCYFGDCYSRLQEERKITKRQRTSATHLLTEIIRSCHKIPPLGTSYTAIPYCKTVLRNAGTSFWLKTGEPNAAHFATHGERLSQTKRFKAPEDKIRLVEITIHILMASFI